MMGNSVALRALESGCFFLEKRNKKIMPSRPAPKNKEFLGSFFKKELLPQPGFNAV
jgi:hypothetical protein